MKRRRLRAHRLILLTVAGKQRRDGRRHLIASSGQQPACRDGGRRIGSGQGRADACKILRGHRHQVRRCNHERHPTPRSWPV